MKKRERKGEKEIGRKEEREEGKGRKRWDGVERRKGKRRGEEGGRDRLELLLLKLQGKADGALHASRQIGYERTCRTFIVC